MYVRSSTPNGEVIYAEGFIKKEIKKNIKVNIILIIINNGFFII